MVGGAVRCRELLLRGACGSLLARARTSYGGPATSTSFGLDVCWSSDLRPLERLARGRAVVKSGDRHVASYSSGLSAD
jgi:hypothetical protein